MKLRMLLAVVEIKAALLDRAVAMSSGFSSCVMGNHGNHGKNRYQVACTAFSYSLLYTSLHSTYVSICTTLNYRYFFYGVILQV